MEKFDLVHERLLLFVTRDVETKRFMNLGATVYEGVTV